MYLSAHTQTNCRNRTPPCWRALHQRQGKQVLWMRTTMKSPSSAIACALCLPPPTSASASASASTPSSSVYPARPCTPTEHLLHSAIQPDNPQRAPNSFCYPAGPRFPHMHTRRFHQSIQPELINSEFSRMGSKYPHSKNLSKTVNVAARQEYCTTWIPNLDANFLATKKSCGPA